MKHTTDILEQAHNIGPRHSFFGQSTDAGGRQLAHPHPCRQYQNRNRNPAVRTPTASNFRHFGQWLEVGTDGFVRGSRPNGERMRTMIDSHQGKG